MFDPQYLFMHATLHHNIVAHTDLYSALGNCGSMCIEFQDSFFAWARPGMGRSLVFLAGQIILFWALVIIIDTDVIVKLFYKLRPKILISNHQ